MWVLSDKLHIARKAHPCNAFSSIIYKPRVFSPGLLTNMYEGQ